jgi:hypothetical protein
MRLRADSAISAIPRTAANASDDVAATLPERLTGTALSVRFVSIQVGPKFGYFVTADTRRLAPLLAPPEWT